MTLKVFLSQHSFARALPFSKGQTTYLCVPIACGHPASHKQGWFIPTEALLQPWHRDGRGALPPDMRACWLSPGLLSLIPESCYGTRAPGCSPSCCPPTAHLHRDLPKAKQLPLQLARSRVCLASSAARSLDSPPQGGAERGNPRLSPSPGPCLLGAPCQPSPDLGVTPFPPIRPHPADGCVSSCTGKSSHLRAQPPCRACFPPDLPVPLSRAFPCARGQPPGELCRAVSPLCHTEAVPLSPATRCPGHFASRRLEQAPTNPSWAQPNSCSLLHQPLRNCRQTTSPGAIPSLEVTPLLVHPELSSTTTAQGTLPPARWLSPGGEGRGLPVLAAPCADPPSRGPHPDPAALWEQRFGGRHGRIRRGPAGS